MDQAAEGLKLPKIKSAMGEVLTKDDEFGIVCQSKLKLGSFAAS